MNTITKTFAAALSAGALAVLAACGGGSAATGSLTVNITDAPIDSAKSVIVQFTGISIKPADGEEIVFDLGQREIDLLALQGGQFASLLQGTTVPAGRYEWMRLQVNAEPGVRDSYVTFDGAPSRDLIVPSGAQTGLKLVSGFTVPVNGSASFTIDFDLRKSITDPQSANTDLHLRPALRLVDNAQVGAIAGTIAAATINACATPRSPYVYVYEGSVTQPDDMGGTGTQPVTTAAASAVADGSGNFAYRAAFLVPGTYTVAFTCQAAGDAAATNDALTFSAPANAQVTNNATATVNF